MLKEIKSSYSGYFVGIWIIYAVIYTIFKSQNLVYAGVLSFSASVIFLPLVLGYSVWLLKSSHDKAKKFFSLLFLSFLLIFVCDFIYKLTFNILQIPLANVSAFPLFSINLTYAGFMLLQIFAFFTIFPKEHFHGKKAQSYITQITILMFAMLSIMFFFAFKTNTHDFNANTLYNLVELILQLTCFIMTILCVATSRNKGIFLISLGCLVGNATNLIINTDMVLHSYNIGSFFESFWILRYLLIIPGLIYIKNNDIYNQNTSEWLYANNSLRSQMVFWSLMFCMISTILTFAILYLLFSVQMIPLLEKNILKAFAVIFVTYSVIWTIVSNFFVKRFYAPLNRIECKINSFMDNKDLTEIDSKCDTTDEIIELKYLENFLHSAFQLAREKQFAEKELVNLASHTANDIAFPITALDLTIEQIPEIPAEQREKLEEITKSISGIANKLLQKYSLVKNKNLHIVDNPKENDSELVLFPITNTIRSVFEQKLTQFAKTGIRFHKYIEPEVERIIVQFNPLSLERILSNLINNAKEAIIEKGNVIEGKIYFAVEKYGEKIRIIIHDNGLGMSKEMVEKLGKCEIFDKKEGHGIGVYSAIKTIESWQGSYSIDSDLVNGTQFAIFLPIAKIL